MSKVWGYFRTILLPVVWDTKILWGLVSVTGTCGRITPSFFQVLFCCSGFFLNEVNLNTKSTPSVLNHAHLFHQNNPGPNAFEDKFIIQPSDAFSCCLVSLPCTTLVFNNYSSCLQSPFTTPCVAHYRQLGFFRYKLLNNYWWEKGHNNRLQKPLQPAFTSWPFIKNHFIPLL